MLFIDSYKYCLLLTFISFNLLFSSMRLVSLHLSLRERCNILGYIANSGKARIRTSFACDMFGFQIIKYTMFGLAHKEAELNFLLRNLQLI